MILLTAVGALHCLTCLFIEANTGNRRIPLAPYEDCYTRGRRQLAIVQTSSVKYDIMTGSDLIGRSEF